MNFLKVINKSSLRKIWAYGKPYKYAIIIITLISTFSKVLGVQIALFSKEMVDGATSNNLDQVIKYATFTGLAFLGQLLIGLILNLYTVRKQQEMRNYIQAEFTRTIYNKSWLSISGYHTGDLLTRLTSDTGSLVSLWMGTVPTIIALSVQFVYAFIKLSQFSFILALLSFVLGPITLLFSWVIGRKLKALTHKSRQAESIYRSYLNESLHNQIILKSFNYIPHNLETLDQMQTNRRDIAIEKTKLSSVANMIMSLGYRIGFFAALSLGAYQIFLSMISFGTFTAFLQLVANVQGPMEGIIRSLPGIISTFASIERLEEIDACEDEPLNPIAPPKIYTIDKFQLSNIDFGYIPEKQVLKSLDLTVNRGEKIAILGNSGQGKTTILRLIMALITPDSGHATIHLSDDSLIPISTATRKLFSYVPQKNILFSGSILSNLKLANPGVSQEDVNLALKASCCNEFIEELPNGLASNVGERVQGFSEGQIQRICIARALLHKTPILILDEATSALDMDTEDQLVKNLIEYYPDLTVMSITHRRAILDVSEKVYKLYNGSLHLLTES